MSLSYTPEHRGRRVADEVRIAAPADHVWEAWADPEKLAHWFVDAARGTVEPHGEYVWTWEGFGTNTLRVVAVEPGRRLVLGMTPAPGGLGALLEITIAHQGGETVVRLVNSGFGEGAEWDNEVEDVTSGWHMALALLRRYVERHFGRPPVRALALRTARVTERELQPLYFTAAGLAQWLAQPGGTMGAAGEPCRLTFGSGRPLTGSVLAVTPRELTLGWDEIGGALELKTFHTREGRAVCLRCLAWDASRAEVDAIGRELEDALDRLTAVLQGAQPV